MSFSLIVTLLLSFASEMLAESGPVKAPILFSSSLISSCSSSKGGCKKSVNDFANTGTRQNILN